MKDRLLRKAREEFAGALTKISVPYLTTDEVSENQRVTNVVPLLREHRYSRKFTGY